MLSCNYIKFWISTSDLENMSGFLVCYESTCICVPCLTLFVLVLALYLQPTFWYSYEFEFSLFPLRYFIAVQKCLGLYSDNGQYSADDVERLSALYNSLKEKYAWSSAVKVN